MKVIMKKLFIFSLLLLNCNVYAFDLSKYDDLPEDVGLSEGGLMAFVADKLHAELVRKGLEEEFVAGEGAGEGEGRLGLKNISRSADGKFHCPECKYLSGHKVDFNLHIRKHTGEKPYVCEVCGNSFTERGSLNRHKRENCNGAGSGSGVGAGGKNLEGLKNILRSVDGKFHCSICDYSSNHKGNFDAHKRIHTGEKPYTCETCGNSFAISSVLKRHMRKHTGEKPYVCDVCDNSFTESGGLARHKRESCNGPRSGAGGRRLDLERSADGKFYCPECEYSSRKKSSIERHIRKHTGEKPYTCNICGDSFTKSDNLARHKRIHTGEKSYVCEVCDNSFTRKDTLKKHKIKSCNGAGSGAGAGGGAGGRGRGPDPEDKGGMDRAKRRRQGD